jgi:DtxR family Mn-dependent transcriptional regulator
MTDAHPSESVENFLKAIYSLSEHEADARVSTNTLSERLSISAPSVTDMAQRLSAAGLVDYEKYRGVALTESGRRVALQVLRRHRLIELYLARELGFSLADVHQEAEALEHAASDAFVEAVARRLGNPHFDPHGDPIPAADGTITPRDLLPLSELPLAVRATIRRFVTSNNDMLQHILDRGFRIDGVVTVAARDPFDGPISVTVDGASSIIGRQVASYILVERAR